MRIKIISGIQIIILVIVSIGLSTFLSPCNGEMIMKCNHSVNVVQLLFITSIVVKVLELFVKEQQAVYFELFSLLLHADSILIPALVIGGCQMKTMPCKAVAFPAIYVTAILLMLINVLSVFFSLKKVRWKHD